MPRFCSLPRLPRLRDAGSTLLALLVLSIAAGPACADDLLAHPADLGLDHWQETRIAAPTVDPDGPFAIDVTIDGTRHDLVLRPHSVRGPNFRLVEVDGDGNEIEHEPYPIRTYRGHLAGVAGSRVAAALIDGGLHAVVMRADDILWIEPAAERVTGAPADLHLIYRTSDMTPVAPVVGIAVEAGVHVHTDSIDADEDSEVNPATDTARGEALDSLCTAELMCDADFPYFQAWGGGTQNRIESVINGVNLIYEAQVGIRHEVGAVYFHSSPDPYAASNPVDLLCQFSVYWTSERSNVSRDIVHQFTGRSMSGDVGFGVVGSVCKKNGCLSFPCSCGPTLGIKGGYCTAQSDFQGGLFSGAVWVSAHNLGHTWGTDDCNCPGFIMNLGPVPASQFSTVSGTNIVTFRETRGCIDCTSNCYETTAAPRCNTASCTLTVCDIDPLCCSDEWDEACVAIALELCGGCGDEESGPCYGRNGSNGCDDPACCATVCAIDPFCCDADWDAVCQKASENLCEDLPCQTDCVARELAEPTPKKDNQFGSAVANAGDVNADGFDDLIIGVPLDDTAGQKAGRIYIISGLTGAVILTGVGEAKNDRFGTSVAGVGDVNEDGFDDVLVGAPENDDFKKNAGKIYLYSGKNGTVLRTKVGKAKNDRFGFAVDGGMDVNGDGRPDFIVGAPLNDDGGNKAGRVYIYSGKNGKLLGELKGKNAGDEFGTAVAALRRADNDEFEDFAVGSPNFDAGGSNTGRVSVYSGEDFSLLYKINGAAAGDEFGSAIARVGTANGDSRDDFVVGSPLHDSDGFNKNGRIAVYSGKNGTLIWARNGAASGDRLGTAVAGGMDLDDNGRDDVVAGAPRHDTGGNDAGRTYMRRGEDGGFIQSIDGDGGDRLGSAVSGLAAACNGFSAVAVSSPLLDNGANATGGVDVWCGPGGGERIAFDAPAADFDGDGAVTVEDLVGVLAALGTCEPFDPCDADLDRSGVVDVMDVLATLDAWTP